MAVATLTFAGLAEYNWSWKKSTQLSFKIMPRMSQESTVPSAAIIFEKK